MALDYWTGESLRQMVAYVTDDQRIAVHLGIPVREVAAARKRLKRGRQQRRDTHGKEPSDAPDRWERDLRQASIKLAEALAEARG